ILGLAMIVLWIPIASVGLLDAWIAMFVWFPFIFAWQVVTYVLERRGILSVPSQESLAARDALPLIQGEKEVVRVGPAAITPERTREA
ncbi:MAG TPA: hypothetical protein VFA32_18920, partial [Dehalococcoidia bacterium]|nr:hypothetical protein [Dehalococcoidia bacterium]